MIKKKFYIGSRKTIENGISVNGDDWTHATLEKAIEHAKELVEESGETQYVVQVVRIIKRKDNPIVVEKV